MPRILQTRLALNRLASLQVRPALGRLQGRAERGLAISPIAT
jgi:hypothetical protein